jgi:hypothetical protein
MEPRLQGLEPDGESPINTYGPTALLFAPLVAVFYPGGCPGGGALPKLGFALPKNLKICSMARWAGDFALPKTSKAPPRKKTWIKHWLVVATKAPLINKRVPFVTLNVWAI